MNIFDLTLSELEQYMEAAGEKKFHARQLFKNTYAGLLPDEMTDLSKRLRDKINEDFEFNLPKIQKKLVSSLDGTVKYIFEMKDGAIVEGVVMAYKHGLSMCVSTQAGCRMGCVFCASGIHGLHRNLSAGEISGQILAALKDLGIRISNIVLMGSGEPFDNFDNVFSFVKIAVHPDGQGIGARHITISTCGLPEGIRRLAAGKIPVNLSVSLHAPDDETRKKLMPIARRVSINELITACREYFKITKRRVTYEYALAAGVNDTAEHAAALVRLIKNDGAHVNLIPVNETPEGPLKKSENTALFYKRLSEAGINVTVRRSIGADISASCGQLRGKYIKGEDSL